MGLIKDPQKSVMSNTPLNHEAQCSFDVKKCLMAESFHPGQPAQSAQAELGRNCLQMHLSRLFTEHGSFYNALLYKYNVF